MTKTTTRPRPRNSAAEKVGSNSRPPNKTAKVTKKARMISLLSKEAGADIASISKRFGWLPHTTRAALTGLRKAGYDIASVKPGNGKPTKYRITSAPAEQSLQ